MRPRKGDQWKDDNRLLRFGTSVEVSHKATNWILCRTGASRGASSAAASRLSVCPACQSWPFREARARNCRAGCRSWNKEQGVREKRGGVAATQGKAQATNVAMPTPRGSGLAPTTALTGAGVEQTASITAPRACGFFALPLGDLDTLVGLESLNSD